ncbi:efflux RND transporter periplasmic adaptor subunit [Saccharicrinis sp. 156]|uniref:efflux RND transporter periplasmic adaptor subunit n=1 Tax=Saccharicrinis sp. 156 TaxID=3417574 RepID=UPI003D347596
MKLKILAIALLSLIYVACNQSNSHEGHDHEAHNHSNEEGHDENEEVKFQYTAYGKSFELFAEADAFIAGKKANVLSHFSVLPDFKAVEKGSITIILLVNGKETKQTLDKPTRKGIYSFDIEPNTMGTGALIFKIKTETGYSEITVPQVTVFAGEREAHDASEMNAVSPTNTIAFTKEQSWKIDFATELPIVTAFGQVIKTVAKIEPARGEESVLTAKAAGIVVFSDNSLLEGKNITQGQTLLTLSSGALAEKNIAVRLAGAKSNYETAKANYARVSDLVKDKLITESEFLEAKKEFETTEAIYNNLMRNFSSEGQFVKSHLNGYVKNIYVANGQYVEEGQALVSLSQNKNLILTAQVQQKYLEYLPSVVSANIKTLHNNKTYTFDELNGKVLSYGKSASNNSFMIPVHLQIANKAGFAPGTLTEVYLKTVTNTKAMTIPNSAILEEQGVFYVFVQRSPELFELREVKLGGTDGIRSEVISEIRATERIVTRGAMQIKLAQASSVLDPHAGHVH